MYNIYYNSTNYFQVETREQAAQLKRQFLQEYDPGKQYTRKYKQSKHFLYVELMRGGYYVAGFDAVQSNADKWPGLKITKPATI